TGLPPASGESLRPSDCGPNCACRGRGLAACSRRPSRVVCGGDAYAAPFDAKRKGHATNDRPAGDSRGRGHVSPARGGCRLGDHGRTTGGGKRGGGCSVATTSATGG